MCDIQFQPWPTPIYINDGAQYISYLPKPEGDDFFNHVAYVDVGTLML